MAISARSAGVAPALRSDRRHPLVAVRPIGEFSKNQSGWAVALRVDGPGPVSTMAGWVGLVDDLVLVLAVPSLDVLATGRDAGECGAVG